MRTTKKRYEGSVSVDYDHEIAKLLSEHFISGKSIVVMTGKFNVRCSVICMHQKTEGSQIIQTFDLIERE